MEYVLEVDKRPYRENDHLAFIIYKLEYNDIGGFSTNYIIIKHYGNLGPLEKNKVGNFVKLYDFKENTYKIYFKFNIDLTQQITKLADIANKTESSYEQQVKGFITLINEIQGLERIYK
ncbi:hypothetical protein [Rossellomorea vietnamensis]|uniref:hypothetical protein n=1 Tax=Rossellomorea vietnamensis TaxID=218284 RepID=UPI003D29BADD